ARPPLSISRLALTNARRGSGPSRTLRPALYAIGAIHESSCGVEPWRSQWRRHEPRGRGQRGYALRATPAQRTPEADPPPTAPPGRACAAWDRGDRRGAVTLLAGAGKGATRYARRPRSELQLLPPGYRLPLGTSHSAPPSRGEGEPLRVLHVLTNSLPHTQSGYSLRSHRILTALRDQGIDSVALTRTGYPVMVGKLLASDEDVVDGIRYVRSLPARLPQTQQERLLAEAHRALELVEEFRPHVIHATTNYQNAVVAQAVAEATGLPWVLEVR